jgi:uncharacterized membrane protein YfhO
LQQPGVVLFKATYHPGWHASVDGVAVPSMVLTPGLLGAQVPAGAHTLRMVYGAGWLKAVLLVAGLLVAIAIDRWWIAVQSPGADTEGVVA